MFTLFQIFTTIPNLIGAILLDLLLLSPILIPAAIAGLIIWLVLRNKQKQDGKH